MHTKNGQYGVSVEECRLLTNLLDTEHGHYRRLLRLAWRQNSYMKRQDVDRLEANATEWTRHLPAADASRIARERCVAELGTRMGVAVPPGRVSDLLDYAAPEAKRLVGASLNALRRTAGSLARQNTLNRNLAEFCLDLAHEETEIFKKCVSEDPTGCYGDNAKTTGRAPGGLLIKQA